MKYYKTVTGQQHEIKLAQIYQNVLKTLYL